MEKTYVQYGSGLSAPPEWKNYDASLSLRIQRTPVLGWFLPRKGNRFPSNVRFGDIIRGLKNVPDNSCDGVFCSHVLEHLALEEFRIALKNTNKILKPGGKFRLIIPDLEPMARSYIEKLDKGNDQASIQFISNAIVGRMIRPKGLRGMIQNHFTYSYHLWMWDRVSMAGELEKAGFKEMRVCMFNDSKDPMFALVEDANRYATAFGMECSK